MKLNKFLWENYKETENAKQIIELFKNGSSIDILNSFNTKSHQEQIDSACFIDDLCNCLVSPILPTEINCEKAEMFFRCFLLEDV